MARRNTGQRQNNKEKPLHFEQKLVLNHWIINKLLGFDNFVKLAERLKSPEYEYFSEDGISGFLTLISIVR